MTEFDPNVTPFLKKPLRDLCPHCRERPALDEHGLCEECALFAQYEEISEGKR